MSQKTEFSLDNLFPDLESSPASLEPAPPPKQSSPLTLHDIIKLTLSLDAVVEKQAARRMLLHHVEPPLKSYIPKITQEIPIDLKLAQRAAVTGDLPRLQIHLADYLKESKAITPSFIVEEIERRVH